MANDDDMVGGARQELSCATVPLVEFCPGCGTQLDGQKCKQVCLNQGCMLYRRIIENCAGD